MFQLKGLLHDFCDMIHLDNNHMNYSPLDAEMSERSVPHVPPAHELPSAPAAAFCYPSGFELTFSAGRLQHSRL